jgi:BirA family biotin operon repressor/biotin-[acetyl-CoA-carboxylase] ligase
LSQQPAHNAIGSPFIELQSVDSTNNYARKQVYADLAQHGMVIFAHEQVAGKGQRGRVWKSQKNENIALSVLINPQPLSIREQFQLSACVAISLMEFFRRYAGDDTTIKWPNDLYWQDRKAGGILIESVIGGVDHPAADNQQPSAQWKWAIAGMGININQTLFSPDLPNPVSLKQITGKTFSPAVMAKELCTLLNENYRDLLVNGFEPVYEKYIAGLYKKGKAVKLKKGSRVFEATIKTVLPDGKLVIQHTIEEIIDFGEADWVIEK